jgi:hypothetical protein
MVQKNEWQKARQALRLYTYETRKSMTRLSTGDPVSQPPCFFMFGSMD